MVVVVVVAAAAGWDSPGEWEAALWVSVGPCVCSAQPSSAQLHCPAWVTPSSPISVAFQRSHGQSGWSVSPAAIKLKFHPNQLFQHRKAVRDILLLEHSYCIRISALLADKLFCVHPVLCRFKKVSLKSVCFVLLLAQGSGSIPFHTIYSFLPFKSMDCTVFVEEVPVAVKVTEVERFTCTRVRCFFVCLFVYLPQHSQYIQPEIFVLCSLSCGLLCRKQSFIAVLNYSKYIEKPSYILSLKLDMLYVIIVDLQLFLKSLTYFKIIKIHSDNIT